MLTLAPVVIFAYKRKAELQRAVEALQACHLANETDLYIFSDGPKSEKDKNGVKKVRNFIQSITGFKKITYFFSEQNKGLGSSIIGGVTKILESNQTIIVLEDDLVPSKNFLLFMNQGLQTYRDDPKIFSISGYNYPFEIKHNETNDAYFLPRTCSYGWATWRSRWEGLDWEIRDFEEFSKNKTAIRKFNNGGKDLYQMLSRQQAGLIDSWAIRWSYNQYKRNAVTVYPILSKIKNTGFSEQSTNTNIYNKYFTEVDKGDRGTFLLPSTVDVDPFYLKQLQNFYSIKNRIKNRILTYLFKLGLLKNKV